MVGEAVECYLVGLRDAGEMVLKKAERWLLTAIEEHEIPVNHYIHYGEEAARLEWLAICRWLLYGKHDQASLDEAIEFEELFHSEAEYPREHVESAMDVYLEAGQLARAVELYESVRLTKPKRWDGVRTGAQLAYMICRHRLGLAYTPDEMQAGVRKVLTRLVPEMLGSGLYYWVALWMKITAWDGLQESAYEALMSCYDYLGGLRRPDL